MSTNQTETNQQRLARILRTNAANKYAPSKPTESSKRKAYSRSINPQQLMRAGVTYGNQSISNALSASYTLARFKEKLAELKGATA